jgi:TAP-like protein
MSRGFSNSVVLTQNSSGVKLIFLALFFCLNLLIFYSNTNFQHCSISAPSLCTAKYVRQYFTDGTLPEPGTICEADLGPFDSDISLKEGSTEDAQGTRRLHRDMDTMSLNEEDKQLLSAIRELSSSQFTNFFPSFSTYDF